jgi:hypothetical protein
MGATNPSTRTLIDQLEHVTFLLNSALLVLKDDPIASRIAAKAVEEARAILKQAKEAK